MQELLNSDITNKTTVVIFSIYLFSTQDEKDTVDENQKLLYCRNDTNKAKSI